MITRASGFTKAGMERWSLYKKLSTLRVHITPNTAVQTKKMMQRRQLKACEIKFNNSYGKTSIEEKYVSIRSFLPAAKRHGHAEL